VELGTYNINPLKIENAIGNKTRGIVFAHTLGNPANMNKIMKIAKEHNLIQARMLAHYHKTTGLPNDVILSKLLPPSDIYLTPEEAVGLGICDFISDLKK
jgi:ATP-dependent protease ClpP protease subunit